MFTDANLMINHLLDIERPRVLQFCSLEGPGFAMKGGSLRKLEATFFWNIWALLVLGSPISRQPPVLCTLWHVEQAKVVQQVINHRLSHNAPWRVPIMKPRSKLSDTATVHHCAEVWQPIPQLLPFSTLLGPNCSKSLLRQHQSSV